MAMRPPIMRLLLAAAAGLGTTQVGSAAIAPSFNLASCAWFASHIVVADEGPQIDGVFTVVECWRGDLAPGAALWLPTLAAYAEPKQRKIGRSMFDEPPDAEVSCRRVVLFLRRMDYPWRIAQGKRDEWLPANRHLAERPEAFRHRHVRTSVAWIEAGGVYVLRQQHAPGPTLFVRDYRTELELKLLTDELLRLRAEFDDLLALPAGDARTAALAAHIEAPRPRGVHPWAARLQTLIARGADELPVLRRLAEASPGATATLKSTIQTLEGKGRPEVPAVERLLVVLRCEIPLLLPTGRWDPRHAKAADALWLAFGLNDLPLEFEFRSLAVAERQELLRLMTRLDDRLQRLECTPHQRDESRAIAAARGNCRQIAELLRPSVPPEP